MLLNSVVLCGHSQSICFLTYFKLCTALSFPSSWSILLLLISFPTRSAGTRGTPFLLKVFIDLAYTFNSEGSSLLGLLVPSKVKPTESVTLITGILPWLPLFLVNTKYRILSFLQAYINLISLIEKLCGLYNFHILCCVLYLFFLFLNSPILYALHSKIISNQLLFNEAALFCHCVCWHCFPAVEYSLPFLTF